MIIRSSRLARFVRILEVYTKQHYNREEEEHTTSVSLVKRYGAFVSFVVANARNI